MQAIFNWQLGQRQAAFTFGRINLVVIVVALASSNKSCSQTSPVRFIGGRFTQCRGLIQKHGSFRATWLGSKKALPPCHPSTAPCKSGGGGAHFRTNIPSLQVALANFKNAKICRCTNHQFPQEGNRDNRTHPLANHTLDRGSLEARVWTSHRNPTPFRHSPCMFPVRYAFSTALVLNLSGSGPLS